MARNHRHDLEYDKYDLGPKLHNLKFNYYSTTSFLKLKIQSLIYKILYFSLCKHVIYAVLSWFAKVVKVVFHFPAVWLVSLNKA